MSSVLYLSQNSLTSKIPTELGKLVKMASYLWLHQNSLSSTIPTQLGRMTKMTSGFQLASNQLCSDVPTEVQALSSSVTSGWAVTTGNNNLGTKCSSLSFVVPTLDPATTTSIDFADQGYSGQIPTEFGLLTGVTSFDLGENSLTSSIPTQLGNMVKLKESFDLGENSLTSSIPTQLGKLVSVTSRFNLASNNFCSDVPTEIQALSSSVTSGWAVTTGNAIGSSCSSLHYLVSTLNELVGRHEAIRLHDSDPAYHAVLGDFVRPSRRLMANLTAYLPKKLRPRRYR